MSNILDFLRNSVVSLATATGGNPVLSVLVVMLFWVWFNFLEATLERLMFGERFEHWLDPIFTLCFIAYAAYSVMGCAYYNTAGQIDKESIKSEPSTYQT